MINFAIRNNLARVPCLLTLQVIFLSRSNGILKRECDVRSPGKIDAATPDDAVARAIKFFDLTVARGALYKNVLPVPLGPSMKNAADSFRMTFYKIDSYACCCSTLRV
ncbi:hypothetical protein F2P56_014609, partial [Juglans regia]